VATRLAGIDKQHLDALVAQATTVIEAGKFAASRVHHGVPAFYFSFLGVR
jgi:hypothetical protein